MNSLLQSLGNDPERMMRALAAVAPLMRKNAEFMRRLQEEKGSNHVVLAKMLFKVFDLVGLMAIYTTRIKDADPAFSEQEQELHLNAMLQMFDAMSAELAQGLGVSKEDFNEISDAARAQSDATFSLSLSMNPS